MDTIGAVDWCLKNKATIVCDGKTFMVIHQNKASTGFTLAEAVYHLAEDHGKEP